MGERRTITAFTEGSLPADGVVRYFNFGRQDETGVDLICRDRDGRQVGIWIPQEDWARVRQDIIDSGGEQPSLT